MSGAGRGTPRISPNESAIPADDDSEGSNITRVLGVGEWSQTFGASEVRDLQDNFIEIYSTSAINPFLERGVIKGAMQFEYTPGEVGAILDVSFRYRFSDRDLWLPMQQPDVATSPPEGLISMGIPVFRFPAAANTSAVRGWMPIPIPISEELNFFVEARETATVHGTFESVGLRFESFGTPAGLPVFGP